MACDDHIGKCEVEDWKFVGVETALIDGHIFKAIKFQVAKPRALSIK